jgi:outer membrane protein
MADTGDGASRLPLGSNAGSIDSRVGGVLHFLPFSRASQRTKRCCLPVSSQNAYLSIQPHGITYERFGYEVEDVCMHGVLGASLVTRTAKHSLRLWSAWLCLLAGVWFAPPVHSQAVSTSSQPQAEPSQPPAPSAPAAQRVLELSLEDAIRLALQNNLDIERERYTPRIQHTEVGKARAAFDPSIGAEGNVGETQFLPTTEFLTDRDPVTGIGAFEPVQRYELTGELTPFFRQKIVTGADYEIRFTNTFENISPTSSGNVSRTIVNPRYESRLELTFTQPLLKDFGISVNKTTIYQTELAESIAEQQLLQTILDIVFAVQDGYWNLVFRIQDLTAKRESLKLAQDFLEENKLRVELGTLAPIEVVQAETSVKTREGDVIVAEAAVEEAADQLKETLNVPASMGTWDLRLRPTDSPPFEPIAALSVEDQVATALANRPDFIQSQLDIASRELARDFARNQKLPRLDLTGAFDVRGFGGDTVEGLDSLGNSKGHSWLVGLRFEYPLGNRFARNEFQRRDLELKQARVGQRRLKLTIVREIRQAVRDIVTASKRVEVTRAATKLAQTQLEAEQERFRLGLSTSFVVLDFQEDLTIARSNETQSLSDYNVALGRLDQLTGRLRYGDITTDVTAPR